MHMTTSTSPALQVTGDTYSHRQELRALGGIWHRETEAWIVPMGSAKKIYSVADARWWHVNEIHISPDYFSSK